MGAVSRPAVFLESHEAELPRCTDLRRCRRLDEHVLLFHADQLQFRPEFVRQPMKRKHHNYNSQLCQRHKKTSFPCFFCDNRFQRKILNRNNRIEGSLVSIYNQEGYCHINVHKQQMKIRNFTTRCDGRCGFCGRLCQNREPQISARRQCPIPCHQYEFGRCMLSA